MPSSVELHGECLIWRVAYNGRGLDSTVEAGRLLPRPITGCLQEFSNLVEATPEDVLAFVQRWGVLGIDPDITEEWVSSDGRQFYLRYQEHFGIYTELARQTRSILTVMQSLKEGRGARKTDLMNCLLGCQGSALTNQKITSEERSFGEEAYRILSVGIHIWWDVASLKMGVPYLDSRNAGKEMPLDFLLSFGHWNDGYTWDDCKLHSSSSSRTNSYAASLINNFQHYIQQRDPWFYRAMILPGSHQRPSPLFNALTYQLLQSVTVQPGWYFCIRCHRLYNHIEVWGEGEGRRKNRPRSDQPGGFCGPQCEAAQDKEKDTLRKRKKAASRRMDC